ncbi:cadherin repeat domain-containing protein, partial [Leeia sp. TBRC 13508]
IVSGGDGAKFSIDSSGNLTFNAAPDYENPTDSDTNNTYIVTVKAVDGAGNFSTQQITVTVTDVDEIAPTITGPS